PTRRMRSCCCGSIDWWMRTSSTRSGRRSVPSSFGPSPSTDGPGVAVRPTRTGCDTGATQYRGAGDQSYVVGGNLPVVGIGSTWVAVDGDPIGKRCVDAAGGDPW